MKTDHKRIILPALALLALSIGWDDADPSTVTFGKIYLYDQTLYVSELTRGIRQLDISVPTSPADVGLIRIDGNHDTALRGTIDGKRVLYADSYADLIVIDATNPTAPVALDTLRNIFGQSYALGWGDDVLLGRPSVMPFNGRSSGGLRGCYGCTETMVEYDPVPSTGPDILASADSRGGATSGRGGSMARFAIVGDYLYCVDYNQLYVLEIAEPARPRFVNRVQIGWGVETIFALGDKLFIGGETGMFIYSITNASRPEYIATFNHLRACDPVVVEGSTAYVTLRGGTRCGTVVSALHLVNVEDLFNPKLIVSYPLPQPIGLDVRDKIAYVCDDSAGVFILDTSDPDNIRMLANISDKSGYDTMLDGDLLIVVGPAAVSFYNVADPRFPSLLGRYLVPAA